MVLEAHEIACIAQAINQPETRGLGKPYTVTYVLECQP